MTGDLIVDLFAGPGGWTEGLRKLDLRDVGLEWDAAATATRAAAGHATIRCDVALYPVEPLIGRVVGAISSAPCQPWCRTGLRLGIVDQPLVHQAVTDLSEGRDTRAELLSRCKDPRSLLAAEPMRYLHAIRPEWVAMEEVPDVLPLFRQYAEVLRSWGYSVWVGVLDSADYGVPQTRQRAALIASRVRRVTAPTPTHTQHPGGAGLFGESLPRWVSTGHALDWAERRLVVSNYGDSTTASKRGERFSDEPCWTITSKVSRMKVVDPRDGSVTRFTMPEASLIQSFPADYPWQGTKTKREEQLGNAMPPLLAAHVVGAATGLTVPGLAGARSEAISEVAA